MSVGITSFVFIDDITEKFSSLKRIASLTNFDITHKPFSEQLPSLASLEKLCRIFSLKKLMRSKSFMAEKNEIETL